LLSPHRSARRLFSVLALGVVTADGVGAHSAAVPPAVKARNADNGSFPVNAVVDSGMGANASKGEMTW